MSLSRLLWVSLYLHPKWQKDEMIYLFMYLFFTSFRRHSCKITSLTCDLASLPGRAQIPRNCEHSTMDRGNLERKWNIASTHWGLVFLLLFFSLVCLVKQWCCGLWGWGADTHQEMCRGVSCSSPSSSSSEEESNSVVLMASDGQSGEQQHF